MRPISISLDMIHIRVYINTFKWKNKMRFRGYILMKVKGMSVISGNEIFYGDKNV